MSKYVKFMRGTPSAFETLTQKDNDTLYFISESDSLKGSLYLGSKQIVCNNNEDISLSLNNLIDVNLPVPITDGQVLTYHIDISGEEPIEYWTASSLEDLVAIPEILVDEASIVKSDSGILMLKDYGKKYYKYIAATEDVEAHYIEQIVDVNNPWKVGLEPRVTSENGELVLAWFEQNSTTVDGLTAQISSLQTAVEDIIENHYTKEETNNAITAAIAKVDHLSYKTVNSTDEIDLNEDKFIYLVANGDKYDEYMVINGTLEKVGDWSVDLSEYATKTELNNKVDKVEGSRLVSEEEIASWNAGEANFVKSVSEEFKVDNGLLSLVAVNKDKVIGLDEAYVTKVEFQTAVGDLSALTASFGEDKTLVDAILELDQRMTWGEL